MNILTPVDQSRRDGIVLPYCVRMAKSLGGNIAVVHVVPFTRSLIPHAMREAEAYVIAVAEGLREQELSAEGIVRRGDPAAVIIELAGELEVEMIVMTARGRSGLGKLVLGSVTDAVLANSQKPVLLLSEATNGVRSDEETQRQSAYLATVVSHRETRGLYSRDQARNQLERLAESGLDRGVLLSTYYAQQGAGAFFDWLDIGFQISTLRKFFPEEAAALPAEEIAQLPETRAA